MSSGYDKTSTQKKLLPKTLIGCNTWGRGEVARYLLVSKNAAMYLPNT
jgi:hypothetical protein